MIAEPKGVTKRRRVCVALSVLAVAVFASVQHARGEDIPVARATLANGLRVVVVRDPIAPVVAVQMTYLAGVADSPAGYPGMAHAQEHMAFRGLAGLSANQLADVLASLGATVNAYTAQTTTSFHITVPAADLPIALHIEASRLRGINDAQGEWQRERGAIEQEVAQDESSPQYRLITAFRAAAFKGTQYVADGVGTRKSFDRTTGAMLHTFRDRWYAPNNAVLVIVGDVDPAQALGDARSLLESIPRRTVPARARIVMQSLAAKDIPGSAGIDVVGYRMPGSNSSDFAAARVLVDALTDRRSAIATLATRGRAVNATAALVDALPGGSLMIAYAGLPNNQGGGVAPDLVQGIVTDYASAGLSPNLIDAAKKRELVASAALPNSVEALADAWTNAVAVEGHNSPADDSSAISNVSVADVNRVAKKYLDPAHALTANTAKMFSAGNSPPSPSGRSESFAPQPTKAEAVPDWARKPAVAAIWPSNASRPVTRTLPNGIKLIVLPEPASATVTIRGRIKITPQVEEAQGQEGVAATADGMFSFGTGSMTNDQFSAALDAIGADEYAGSRFGAHVVAADFDRAVQLLAEHELNPDFSARGFAIAKQHAMVEAFVALFGGNLVRTANEHLYQPSDPALRNPTEESIDALTVDVVKEFFRKAYRPDLTSIVVAGPVTADQAYDEVEKWFGGWSEIVPPPSTDLPPAANNQPDAVWVDDRTQAQAKILMTETVGILRSDPQYYALQLGNQIVGDPTFASRFFTDLRESRGLVYSVGARLDAGDTRSTYEIEFACDPSNVSVVESIVRRDLATMRATVPGSDEFERARLLMLNRLALQASSEDAIADRLLELSVRGLPVDETLHAADVIGGLKADDVRSAFAKWIRPDGFVTVGTGPKPK